MADTPKPRQDTAKRPTIKLPHPVYTDAPFSDPDPSLSFDEMRDRARKKRLADNQASTSAQPGNPPSEPVQKAPGPEVADTSQGPPKPSPPQTDSWNGCITREKLNGGYVILSPLGAILVETDDTVIDVTEKVIRFSGEVEIPVDCVADEDLVVYKVFGRCRHLFENLDSFAAKKGPRNWSEDLNGKKSADGTIINAAYIGVGMCLQGPIFARQDPMVKGSDPEDRSRFNLKGMALKVEPRSTVVGLGTIPHYNMTTQENLMALKKLVNGKPAEKLLSGPELKYYSDKASKLMTALHKGASLSPPSRSHARTFPELAPGTRVDDNIGAELQTQPKSMFLK
ncbi:hypothetical protein TARUN_533 [Trichoderma arundinaceum]|uniref:Uncharacterized protein n=1 Tax=Trichoderma arundinaceum TaxID=490622 RepID=A0A395NZW1_TRIAR|nr:hypothetical protein TARUN_533 [Trichoderma arundinaceum]